MEETVDLSPYAIFEMMERLEYEDLKRLCSSYTGLRDLCKDPIAIEIIRKKKIEMLERLDYEDLKRLCSIYTGLRDLCKDPIAIEIIRKKKREMLERSSRPQLNDMAYEQRLMPGWRIRRLRRSELINLLEETDV